jgi:hypothetical protein
MLLRSLLSALLLLAAACSRGPAAAPDAGVQREKLRWVDPLNTLAELSGRLEVPMKSERRVAFVSSVPCARVLQEPTLITQVEVEAPPKAEFYLKFWQARGTEGHLCAVAMDASHHVVGLGSAGGPPLHFGEDQLVREGLVLTLAPVPPGTRAPQLIIDTPH